MALELKLIDLFPASEFGDKIGNLLTPQNPKEINMLSNFNKFKKLSGEDLAAKILEFLTK